MNTLKIIILDLEDGLYIEFIMVGKLENADWISCLEGDS